MGNTLRLAPFTALFDPKQRFGLPRWPGVCRKAPSSSPIVGLRDPTGKRRHVICPYPQRYRYEIRHSTTQARKRCGNAPMVVSLTLFGNAPNPCRSAFWVPTRLVKGMGSVSRYPSLPRCAVHPVSSRHFIFTSILDSGSHLLRAGYICSKKTKKIQIFHYHVPRTFTGGSLRAFPLHGRCENTATKLECGFGMVHRATLLPFPTPLPHSVFDSGLRAGFTCISVTPRMRIRRWCAT